MHVLCAAQITALCEILLLVHQLALFQPGPRLSSQAMPTQPLTPSTGDSDMDGRSELRPQTNGGESYLYCLLAYNYCLLASRNSAGVCGMCYASRVREKEDGHRTESLGFGFLLPNLVTLPPPRLLRL